jgi:hypothetical protein
MNVNKSCGVYHQTSVDLAKTAHTTIARIAQKRKFDDYDGGDKQAPSEDLASVEFRRPTVQLGHSLRLLNAGRIRDVIDRGPSEYSQRRTLALTPTPTSNPLLDLSHLTYGLPE